jgi:hypothetical protein
MSSYYSWYIQTGIYTVAEFFILGERLVVTHYRQLEAAAVLAEC